MKHDDVTPYGTGGDKKSQVTRMFDNISRRYDLLNSILSLGIHKGWRNRCVKLLAPLKPRTILDVATGTADFAIACARLHPASIVGIDLSEGMLEAGRKKIAAAGLNDIVTLRADDAESCALPAGSFDAAVVGFGVRNFQDLEKGLRNIHRMLAPGGKLVVLEFSYPANRLVRAVYDFYLTRITPLVGKIFSRDKRAYAYLTESVKAFPHNEKFVEVMERCGYVRCSFATVTFGVAAIYSGSKPA